MDMLKDWLYKTHSRQRSYAANRCKELKLHMGDVVNPKMRKFQGGSKT